MLGIVIVQLFLGSEYWDRYLWLLIQNLGCFAVLAIAAAVFQNPRFKNMSMIFIILLSFTWIISFLSATCFELAAQQDYRITAEMIFSKELIKVAFRDIIKTRYVYFSAGSLVLILILARVLRDKIKIFKSSRACLLYSGIFIISLFGPKINLFYIVPAQGLQSLGRKSQSFETANVPFISLEGMDRSKNVHLEYGPRYAKVILIVMESISLPIFEKYLEDYPASYLSKFTKESNLYVNFHTMNIDSRTTHAAIMLSRFIPYKAYAQPVDPYAAIYKHSALLEYFKHFGFHSIYSISNKFLPTVGTLLDWDTKIKIDDPEKYRHNFACLEISRFEDSCEDLALLQENVDEILNHEKTFAFIELIVNHTEDYNKSLNMRSLDYYSLYLERLIGKLAEKNALKDSLVLLVGDHGPRSGPEYKFPSNYSVPLIVHAPHTAFERNQEFFGMTDLKDILLSQLTLNTLTDQRKEPLLAIGTTNSDIQGLFFPDGRHILIDRRSEKFDANFSGENLFQLVKFNFDRYLDNFNEEIVGKS
jgi:hypothetical protein